MLNIQTFIFYLHKQKLLILVSASQTVLYADQKVYANVKIET